MKIKLRPDQPGSSGPSEWSEMNDWLANLREDPDAESATPSGPAEARDQAQAHHPPASGDDARSQTYGPAGPPADVAHPSAPWAVQARTTQTYGAPVLGDHDEADAPTETDGTGDLDAVDEPVPEVTSEPDEPRAATAADGTDTADRYEAPGLHQATGSYEVPAAALAAGADAFDAAGEANVPAEPGAADDAVAPPAPPANPPWAASPADTTAPATSPNSRWAASPADTTAPPAPAANPTWPSSLAGSASTAAPTGPTGSAPSVMPAPPASSVPPASLVWSPSPGAPSSTGPRPAAAPPVTPAPAASARPVAEEEITVGALIGDELRTPMVWCELEPGNCVSWYGDRAALGVADVRNRAIAAGWRIDAMGRLTCPQCQQRCSSFRATQQVVLWNRAYALTMAAREAARQGEYPYPQPAFYPRS